MGEVIAENGLEPDIRYRHKISSVAVGPVVSRPERCSDHCVMLGGKARRSPPASNDVTSHAFLTCYCYRLSHRCAMTGIAEWLASIGLGEYAQRFGENAIDLS